MSPSPSPPPSVDARYRARVEPMPAAVVATILDTVGALVAVLDPRGCIVRVNRACERASGRECDAVRGLHIGELCHAPDDARGFRRLVERWCTETAPAEHEASWVTAGGERRIIAWSGTVLRAADGRVEHIIATGNDITERRHLERALLDVSGREQRRIGQDLHDGLGQHLTGTAFMSKALQQRLEERALPEASEAGQIVRLVNEAIEKTRELSRILAPVVSGADGLTASLQRFAAEVEGFFRVSCRFVCDAPVRLDDVAVATQLFHVAREAVSNAIKHGGATRIVIALSVRGDTGHLSIADDGVGLGNTTPSPSGMGLHIMAYRASLIGGALEVTHEPDAGAGTTVECRFPMRAPE